MATMTAEQPRRRWMPWVHAADFDSHLSDDREVHRQAGEKTDEILTGIDALNLSVNALSTKLGPLLPITADLDQIVGRRRFRHQIYKLAGQTGRSIKKILGWGGGTIVGLATIAAVNQQAQNLLLWLLNKITFGAVSVARVPDIAATPPIPGVTH